MACFYGNTLKDYVRSVSRLRVIQCTIVNKPCQNRRWSVSRVIKHAAGIPRQNQF